MKKGHKIGIVGATGAVGLKILQVLDERVPAIESLQLYASQRSAGSRLNFRGEEIVVQPLTTDSFKDIDFAFFSAGTEISREYCPIAVKAGCIAIDNSNAHRMNPEVPLVVPEVNPQAAFSHKGLIANPNCSTIQLVCAIAPIHRKNPIKRLVVSTYQSVSGTGLDAIAALKAQSKEILEDKPINTSVYPHQIGFNLIPQIDIYNPDTGLYLEEEKVIKETQKILSSSIPMSVTAVRVPIFYAHSESVNIELTHEMSLSEVKNELAHAANLVLLDEPANSVYPMPHLAYNKDEVFVGRLRRDTSVSCGYDLFVVSDNLRKGAATNAVQIYQLLTQA